MGPQARSDRLVVRSLGVPATKLPGSAAVASAEHRWQRRTDAVPEFDKNEGAGGFELALYDNIMTGSWRYCFGGTKGKSKMAKCIRDEDPVDATTYDVNAPAPE